MSRTAVIGLVLLAVAIVGAVVFAGPVVDYWRQRTADAEAGREGALDNAAGRGLEVEGTQVLAEASDQDRAAVIIIRESAHALDVESRADVNASTPLPDSVLDRLRAGDRGLYDSGVQRRSGSGPAEPGAPGPDPGVLQGNGD